MKMKLHKVAMGLALAAAAIGVVLNSKLDKQTSSSDQAAFTAAQAEVTKNPDLAVLDLQAIKFPNNFSTYQKLSDTANDNRDKQDYAIAETSIDNNPPIAVLKIEGIRNRSLFPDIVKLDAKANANLEALDYRLAQQFEESDPALAMLKINSIRHPEQFSHIAELKKGIYKSWDNYMYTLALEDAINRKLDLAKRELMAVYNPSAIPGYSKVAVIVGLTPNPAS